MRPAGLGKLLNEEKSPQERSDVQSERLPTHANGNESDAMADATGT